MSNNIQQVTDFGGAVSADADGICASQTPAAGGEQSLTINGALASGGSATLDIARRVSVTSAGNDSGRTFTITGTDRNGSVISEALTGANATAAVSVLDFLSVTAVTTDDDTAGAVTVGTTDSASSAWLPLDLKRNPFNASVAVEVSSDSTLNYTVQYCIYPHQTSAGTNIYDDESLVIHNHDDSNLVSATTTAVGNYAFPCTHSRVFISSGLNSGTGITKKLIQCGR